MTAAIGISTHTSLAGRDEVVDPELPADSISTHTSLAGRDQRKDEEKQKKYISTHTSLAGRDVLPNGALMSSCRFLLTRPSRDVTRERGDPKRWPDFYSHVPRGT